MGSVFGGLNWRTHLLDQLLGISHQNLSVLPLPPSSAVFNPTISPNNLSSLFRSHISCMNHISLSAPPVEAQNSKLAPHNKTKNESAPIRYNVFPTFLNLKSSNRDKNMQYTESSSRTPYLHVQLSSIPTFNQIKQLLVPCAEGRTIRVCCASAAGVRSRFLLLSIISSWAAGIHC